MFKLNLEPRTLPEARTELASADAQIKVLDGQILAKDTEIAANAPKLVLADQAAGLQTKVTSLTAGLEAMTTRATAAETKVTDLTGKMTTAEAKVTDFDAKVETAASSKAIDLLAAKGLAPLAIKEKPPGAKSEIDPTLKGRDRVAAAFNKQLVEAGHLTGQAN